MHCKRFIFGLYIPCFLLSLLSPGYSQAAQRPLIVKGILFSADTSGGEWVTLACNQSCIPVIFSLEGENPRVVLDMKGVSLIEVTERSISTRGNYVTKIRSYLDKKTKILRIVLDMEPSGAYIVSPISDPFNNTYVVAIEKSVQKPGQNRDKCLTILHSDPEPEAPKEAKPQAAPPVPESRSTATIAAAAPAADQVRPQPAAGEPAVPVAAERHPPARESPFPLAAEPSPPAGNLDAEIRKLTQILAAHPQDCLSYRLRGNAYDALGHREKAIEDWIQAARLGDAIIQSYLDFLQVKWRN